MVAANKYYCSWREEEKVAATTKRRRQKFVDNQKGKKTLEGDKKKENKL